MYDEFRNELTLKFSEFLEPEKVNEILILIDSISYKYEFNKIELLPQVYIEDLPEEVKQWLACKLIEGKSKEGLKNCKYILTLFFKEIKKPVNMVTANDIRYFLYDYQSKKNISLRTLDKYREMIGRFFKWCVEESIIQKDITTNVKPIKYDKTERGQLTLLQLEEFRNSAKKVLEKNTSDKGKIKALRDMAIIEFMYSTGCRVSELCTAKLSDVNWDTKEVILFGKGKKQRKSYITARCEVALKNYLEFRKSNEENYLFTSIKAPYNKMTKSNIEKIFTQFNEYVDFQIKVTPHILRHTMATIAINNGMPIEDLSKLLGHESINTTLIYAKQTNEKIQMEHKKFIV